MNQMSKPTVFTVVMLAIANIVLSSMLFYAVVPKLKVVPTDTDMIALRESVVQAVDVDAISVWTVDLNANTRRIATYSVKDKTDHTQYSEFIDRAKQIKFAAAVKPEVLRALMLGESYCYRVSTGGFNLTVMKEFLSGYPDSMVCSIPIMNRFNVPNGYINLLWKYSISEELQSSVIRQVKSMTTG